MSKLWSSSTLDSLDTQLMSQEMLCSALSSAATTESLNSMACLLRTQGMNPSLIDQAAITLHACAYLSSCFHVFCSCMFCPHRCIVFTCMQLFCPHRFVCVALFWFALSFVISTNRPVKQHLHIMDNFILILACARK